MSERRLVDTNLIIRHLVQDHPAHAKVAARLVAACDRGELLLIQRADSGVWLYPTGWCDVGYSASEVVVKEVLEETGNEGRAIREANAVIARKSHAATETR